MNCNIVRKNRYHCFNEIRYISTALLILSSLSIASAQYASDGFTLETIRHDTVVGGVYVAGGHGVGTPPYLEVFEDVPSEVLFAYLYVGVKGGTKEATGWVSVVFNGHDLETISLAGLNDTNPDVYCSGNGEYWIHYDVTEYTTGGNDSTVTITTGGKINGRVKGTTLVAVYSDSAETRKEYWICEGNINLNYRTEYDIETISFERMIGSSGDLKSATLWTMYLSGNEGVNDTLSFNGNLIAEDAADGGCIEDGVYVWRDLCFDLDCRDVTDYIQPYNSMTYDRRADGYLQPVCAVLVVEQREKAPVPSSGSTESTSESTPGFGSLPAILMIIISTIVVRRLP
ncbi:MAG TPA: DUF3344 domain-containing protein [Methanosarcinales archaeon]|nr:DUF3344 domain-containing protein [Methanosarcinales archaeon]